jgi:hypothetical protein
MAACRGAQPRGWRRLMREGEIDTSLHVTQIQDPVSDRRNKYILLSMAEVMIHQTFAQTATSSYDPCSLHIG